MQFTDLPTLKETIDRHGLSAKKSLGQHFLLDGAITKKIAACAGELSDTNVIEIGPGPGGLTRALLAAGAKNVYVVEKDERCLAIMEELKAAAGERLHIIHADALEVDAIAAVPAPRAIVANLPYNIGTELLLGWLEQIYLASHTTPFASLTLMFQKEVAERITATHGNKDYGRLSVLCQWLCECHENMLLPPGAFSPPPKVSSMVVTLVPRKKPLVAVSKPALEKVMLAAFGQRRKMLRGSLKTLGIDTEKLLAAAGIDGTLRAEQLDVATLCGLALAYEDSVASKAGFSKL